MFAKTSWLATLICIAVVERVSRLSRVWPGPGLSSLSHDDVHNDNDDDDFA